MISKLEQDAHKVAEELGEKIVKELGSGDFGTAFLLESGKVLKLTFDTNEVNVAKKLTRNKNLFNNIMNYYNVGELETDSDYKYFILMDYVEPLNELEKVAINVFKELLQFSHSFYKSVFSEQLIDYVNNQFTPKRINQTGLFWKYYDEIPKIKQIAINFIPKIQAIAKDLKLHHIEQCDFHGNNLGWNKDHTKLIIFDITKPFDIYARKQKPKVKFYPVLELLDSPSRLINNRIKEIAEDLGEELESFLGNGAYGYAFKTKSNKALKITSDRNEANIAYKLSKNKNWIKCLVNYYNVGRISPSKVLNYRDINCYEWYILMDYTEPLSEEEQEAVHCYIAPMQYKQDYYKNILDKEEVMDNIESMYGDPESWDYKRAMSNEKNPERIKQIAIDIYPKIVKIAKELKKHNIPETDFHGGNVGWDKEHENLILYDLGGSIRNSYNYHSKFKEIVTTEKLITKFKNFNI
jgi:hypothetical protein